MAAFTNQQHSHVGVGEMSTLLLADKLVHVTGAVCGEGSAREGASITASVGGRALAEEYATRPPEAERTESRRVVRGLGESVRPRRRLLGPAATIGRSRGRRKMRKERESRLATVRGTASRTPSCQPPKHAVRTVSSVPGR
jgi:hypothetical protein